MPPFVMVGTACIILSCHDNNHFGNNLVGCSRNPCYQNYGQSRVCWSIIGIFQAWCNRGALDDNFHQMPRMAQFANVNFDIFSNMEGIFLRSGISIEKKVILRLKQSRDRSFLWKKLSLENGDWRFQESVTKISWSQMHLHSDGQVTKFHRGSVKLLY